MSILFTLAGVYPKVIKECSFNVRKKYKNLGLAQVMIMFIAAFSAFDVAHNFTDNLGILAVGAFGYALIVGMFDYFLITGPKSSKWFEMLRYVVALANQIISISAIFVFLNSSTINNKISESRSRRLESIDAFYESARHIRWKEYDDLEKQKNLYHNNECMQQARNIYPGPLYEKLHKACINNEANLKNIKERIDITEAPIKKAYEDQRKAILDETSNDFFIKVQYLPEVLFNNWFKCLIAFCLFLFTFYLETLAISMKMSTIDSNDEYHQKLEDYNKRADQRKKEEEKISTQNSIQQVEIDEKKAEANHVQQQFIFYRELLKQVFLNEADQKLMQKIVKTYGFVQSEPVLNKMDDVLGQLKNLYQENRGPLKTTNIDEPNHKPFETIYTGIFKINQAIIDVIEKLKAEALSTEELMQKIYDWVHDNIVYDEVHAGDFYRTAIETFRSRRGLCGEMSVLVMAMLKYCGIQCHYLRITKDCNGKDCLHACVGIFNAKGNLQMLDIAFHAFDLEPQHLVFISIDDQELENNYVLWNK